MKSLVCVLLLAGIAWGQWPRPSLNQHWMRFERFVPNSGEICVQYTGKPVECENLRSARHLPVLPLQEPSTLGTVTDIGPHENYQISEGTYEGLIVPYPKVTEPSYYWDDDKPDDAPFTCRPHETQPNSFVCKIARHAEPSDVPAIQHTDRRFFYCGSDGIAHCDNGKHIADMPSFLTGGSGCPYDDAARKLESKCGTVTKWTCADKSRILLTAENGEKHCVRF